MDFKNLNVESVCQCFQSGIDCSQVVFAHCADQIGFSEEEALKTAAAFGGGMFAGETCGAVTGAFMALGYKYGHCKLGDEQTKQQFMEKKAEFEKRFKEAHDSLICRDILGYDLTKPDEMEKIMEKGLMMTLCPQLVLTACDIMDDML